MTLGALVTNDVRILLLEDSRMDAELLREYLKEHLDSGFELLVVGREKDFVAALSTREFDLVLSDFSLPDLDGFKALAHARALCPRTPFICISGCIGEESAVELLKLGATDFVLKDRLGRLCHSIDRALQEVKDGERIQALSFHDDLTGLYNRRFYEEELLRLDTDRNLPLSFIIGDVNGLKLVNDSFGHAAGDSLLRKVADVMKAVCRADDIVARLSGDEFAILIPHANAGEAENLIQRLRTRLSSEKIGVLDVSVAFGSATKNRVEEPFQEVFKTAEDQLYRNKLYESHSMQTRTIDLIMRSLFEINPRERMHSTRVSELCARIATKLDCGNLGGEKIRLAGLMHDIGKVTIQPSVLNKEGKLTHDEWDEVRQHPEVGYRILGSASEFSEISEYVLEHHERWDGMGYPRGLKGEGISLPARIIAVADAYDAMTTERTYKRVMTHEEALVEIQSYAGLQFDPQVVGAFLETFAAT